MKVQLPWLNKASGRSTGTIYQSYWGATYTRSMPTLFHYADTDKQQRTQAIFFDFQRIWLPIYNVLSRSISKQQRANKNPFNVMSSFIYKIFKPFSINPKEEYPSNFGIDRLNRVRPVANAIYITVASDYITLRFDMNRPYNGMSFYMDKTNILLFNITRQSMLYKQVDFVADTQEIDFVNGNEWKDTDKIVFYMALSCDIWLGNFNKFDSWLK